MKLPASLLLVAAAAAPRPSAAESASPPPPAAAASIFGSEFASLGEGGVLHVKTHANPTGRRSRRLAPGAPLTFEEVPLVPGYGTHFSYVYVGTPPQRASVIIDTGSHYTAFPCNECKSCGSGHTDSAWDLSASSTARVLGCGDCLNARCSASGSEQRCVFGQSYSEGSSWTAFQVMDKLYCGGISAADTPMEDEAYTVDFLFGCISNQNGLFLTQLADGIMGMSADEVTLLFQMYEAGVVASHSFSLCFHEDGGTMVIGGHEPLLHPDESLVYTENLTHKGWYTVSVEDLKLDGKSVGSVAASFNTGKGAIVDSGTTDTYLPAGIASAFKAKWKEITGSDFNNSAQMLTAAQVEALPVITYILKGGVEWNVKPTAYMEKGGEGKYTARVYVDEPNGAVLGANSMKDHEIFFDHDNNRVGIAPSNCAYDDLQNTKAAAAAAKGGEGTGSAGGEAEPSDSGAGEDCALAEDMVRVSPCSAACEAVDGGGVAQGFETWKPQYRDTATSEASACPPLQEETRPCVLDCPKAAAGDPSAGEACSEFSAWSECGTGCSQRRNRPLENGKCAEQERNCHIGIACPAARLGLLVSGLVKISATLPDSSKLEYSQSMGDSVTEALSKFIHLDHESEKTTSVAAGDIEVISHQLKKGTISLVLDVHLFPTIDNLLAKSIKAQLEAGSIESLLWESLKNDPNFSSLLTITDLQFGKFDILTAADRLPYEDTTPHVDVKEGVIDEGETSNGSISTSVLWAFAFGLVALIALYTLRRRRRMRASRGPSYRPVGGDRGGEDDEFEMGLRDVGDSEIRMAAAGRV